MKTKDECWNQKAEVEVYVRWNERMRHTLYESHTEKQKLTFSLISGEWKELKTVVFGSVSTNFWLRWHIFV